MRNLRGKTALVTGASSGIGWATALAFSRRGCRLVLAARRTEKLAELGRRIRSEGGEALEVSCDVRERPQAEAAVEAAARAFGGLDVLVNNAGILSRGPFDRQDIADIEDVLRTNLFGAIYCLRAAISAMRGRGGGHIVNVASIAGWIGLPTMAAYCASKFALVGLTEALRRELRGTGVTLTALCPGLVDTPMAKETLQDPKIRKSIRPKTAEQVAERIVQAVLKRRAEDICGELPGPLLKLSKFFPRTSDWAVAAATGRLDPLARRLRGEGGRI